MPSAASPYVTCGVTAGACCWHCAVSANNVCASLLSLEWGKPSQPYTFEGIQDQIGGAKGVFLRRQVPSIHVAIVRFAKNGYFWWKRREKSLKVQGNPIGTTCKWRPLASRDIELENWKHMLETTMLGGIMGWFSVWMRKQRLGHKVALWGQTFSQSLYRCHADVSNVWRCLKT